MDTTEWKTQRAAVDMLPLLRRALWLGLAGLLAIGVTFVALQTVQRDLEDWVIRTREVARLGRNARTYAGERVAGIRALLITKDLNTVAPEVAAHRALGPALDTLLELTRDNPTQHARVQGMRSSLKAWDEAFLLPALRNVALQVRGQPTQPLADPTGNTLFEPVRVAFNEFVQEEERLFTARLEKARRFQIIVMAVVLAELLLLGLLIVAVMRRATAQAHLVVEQREQLEADALELELQSAELGETAFELEEQMQQAEESAAQLEQQQHFLRQVIDTMPHLVFAKDRAGRFTLANEAIATVYGTTPEGLVGKTDADFNHNAEEVAAFLRDDLAVMDALTTRHIPEEVVTDASGTKRWLTTVKRALPNGDGRAHQILGISTDITERRHLEKQLLQAQKMEAVGRLAGGVAHDFNNLLTVIASYTDLLLQDLESSAQRADVEEIRRASERATDLTRQLLAFSRTQVLQPTTLSVNTVVTNIEKMLARLIGADIELTTTLATDVGSVSADAGQLEQVIMNLVVNARDAMPDGGRITIETADVELAPTDSAKGRAVPPGAYVMLAVSDTGHGMTSDVLAHVFEPFFTTKGAGKGTGLGLSTVYGIVRQSGGDVWVYSEVGQGTTFKVYLPRVDTLATAPHAEPPAAASPRGAETILLADDDDALRTLACRVLRAQGYTVLEARNGRDAIELCSNHSGPIDLILSDIVMPELGGRGLAEGIATTRPHARVLLMSGYTDDDVLRRALVDRRTEFLQKPFTPSVLAKRVRDVLDMHRQAAVA